MDHRIQRILTRKLGRTNIYILVRDTILAPRRVRHLESDTQNKSTCSLQVHFIRAWS